MYSCCYVSPLWHIVNNVFGVNVKHYQILGLDENFKHNAIITIVCFVIYKQWLLEGRSRSSEIALNLLKYE